VSHYNDIKTIKILMIYIYLKDSYFDKRNILKVKKYFEMKNISPFWLCHQNDVTNKSDRWVPVVRADVDVFGTCR